VYVRTWRPRPPAGLPSPSDPAWHSPPDDGDGDDAPNHTPHRSAAQRSTALCIHSVCTDTTDPRAPDEYMPRYATCHMSTALLLHPATPSQPASHSLEGLALAAFGSGPKAKAGQQSIPLMVIGSPLMVTAHNISHTAHQVQHCAVRRHRPTEYCDTHTVIRICE
jgi:hypothetical protein